MGGLLDLPVELREKIYEPLLVRHGPVEVRSLSFKVDPWIEYMWEHAEMLSRPLDVGGNDDDDDNNGDGTGDDDDNDDVESDNDDNGDMDWRRKTGILRVSKKISEEALGVLYGRNLFVVNLHAEPHEQLRKFGSQNLRRIRNLCFIAQPMGISYGTPLKLVPDTFLPVLEDLRKLCIVAQQPLEARIYYGAPSLEQDLEEWITWLEPILRDLGNIVAKTTSVEIDDDNRAETSALVKKYFPQGYEKVQTVTGDRIFMRGAFSWESGYWDDDGRDGCNFADGGMGEDWSD